MMILPEWLLFSNGFPDSLLDANEVGVQILQRSKPPSYLPPRASDSRLVSLRTDCDPACWAWGVSAAAPGESVWAACVVNVLTVSSVKCIISLEQICFQCLID